MAETKMLIAKKLTDKAGVTPQVLRKILRKEFNRAAKTLVESNSAAIFILEAQNLQAGNEGKSKCLDFAPKSARWWYHK